MYSPQVGLSEFTVGTTPAAGRVISTLSPCPPESKPSQFLSSVMYAVDFLL